MNTFIKKIYYTIFFNKKKSLYVEKDEIKVSMWVLKNELDNKRKLAYADSVFSKIEDMPEFKSAKKILFYWSSHNDLPTYDYIVKWSKEKEIILPSVKKNKLSLKKFIGIEPIAQKEAIKFEPNTEKYDGNVDLAIIPALAFDKNKSRMGQGRGYYGHFLKHRHVKTIGVGYDFQLIEKVPGYWKDFTVKTIVTPSSMIS